MTGATNEFMDEADERGQKYTRPARGKSIAEQLWDELDLTVDQIAGTPNTAPEMEALKAYARGLTFALHLMMKPHYNTAAEIAAEAGKRYRIRKGMIEFEPTPGYNYNPPPPGSAAYEKAMQAEDVPQVRASTRKTRQPKVRDQREPLTDQEKEAITTAVRSGMFPVEQVAGVYKVSVEEVNQLVAATAQQQ